MSANLTLQQVIEKNRIASSNPYLVMAEIDVRESSEDPIVETLRVVNNTEEVVYGGLTYYPFPFEVDLGAEAGEAREVRLGVNDIAGAIRQRLVDYKGGTSFDVRILVVNIAFPNDPPEVSESYKVKSSSADDYRVTLNLGLENHLTIAFPRRRHSRLTCPWVYKSAHCGYTGALATCDRSLGGTNGCKAHGNERNFGGFPAIIDP